MGRRGLEAAAISGALVVIVRRVVSGWAWKGSVHGGWSFDYRQGYGSAFVLGSILLRNRFTAGNGSSKRIKVQIARVVELHRLYYTRLA